MCFSETQSYINSFILILVSIYKISDWKLSLAALYLSIKDLIQGLLYKYLKQPKILNKLSILSWLHISFQPFIIHLFFSHFDIEYYKRKKDTKNLKKSKKYWKIVYVISIIFGILCSLDLNDINIFTNKRCRTTLENNYCWNETTSYQGKYHIGYRFNRNNNNFFYYWFIMAFLPGIFSKSLPLYLIFGVVSYLIHLLNVRKGEKGAIWCFLIIIVLVPFALFSEKIIELLKNY